MSRNHYEDALGVTRFDWKPGRPDNSENFGQVLVEVWTPELAIRWDPKRPRVVVHARTHVWQSIIVDGVATWHHLTWSGRLEVVGTVDARRWARLPQRRWDANVTIDGWAK